MYVKQEEKPRVWKNDAIRIKADDVWYVFCECLSDDHHFLTYEHLSFSLLFFSPLEWMILIVTYFLIHYFLSSPERYSVLRTKRKNQCQTSYESEFYVTRVIYVQSKRQFRVFAARLTYLSLLIFCKPIKNTCVCTSVFIWLHNIFLPEK